MKEIIERLHYTIYNQRIAGFLVLHDFPLVRLTTNCRSSKNCFFEIFTDVFHVCIDCYQVE